MFDSLPLRQRRPGHRALGENHVVQVLESVGNPHRRNNEFRVALLPILFTQRDPLWRVDTQPSEIPEPRPFLSHAIMRSATLSAPRSSMRSWGNPGIVSALVPWYAATPWASSTVTA